MLWSSVAEMKSELGRRLSLAKQIEHFMRQHPNEWIPIAELAKQGGVGGFRTRLSELNKRGFTTEHNGKNGELSAHRYLPNGPRMGRESVKPDPVAEKHPPVPQTLFPTFPRS